MIFLDAAYPGTASDCQQAAQVARAGGWFVYVGGPRCAGHWTPTLAQQVRLLGFQTLPIFVGLQVGDPLSDGNGYQDGLSAVACAQAFGFTAGPLVLDVEAGTASFNGGVPARAYATGWIRAVRSQGWRAWIYSVTWFCKSVDCDGRWAAAYSGTLVDPAALGVDAVQSINSVRYGPLEVDVSTVNLPEPAPLPDPQHQEDDDDVKPQLIHDATTDRVYLWEHGSSLTYVAQVDELQNDLITDLGFGPVVTVGDDTIVGVIKASVQKVTEPAA